MTTFAEDILEVAGDEPILAISVGPRRGQSYLYGDMQPDHDLGSEPAAWGKAFDVLNYSYDAGYGGQDCHDIWVWTETRVLFVHEYDGSTGVAYAPRNPTAFTGPTQ